MDRTIDRKMVHKKRLNSNNYRREEKEESINHIVAQSIICAMVVVGILIIKLVGVEVTDNFVASISQAISEDNIVEVMDLTQTVFFNEDDGLLIPIDNIEGSNTMIEQEDETEILVHTDFAINQQLQEELTESRGEVAEKK